MATITYTLDPAGGVNDGYTRTSFANIESHYNTSFGSRNLVSTTNNIVIRIVTDVTENYSFTNWTTSSTYNIEVYGWDGSAYDRSIQIKAPVNSYTGHMSIEKDTYIHHVKFVGAAYSYGVTISGTSTYRPKVLYSDFTGYPTGGPIGISDNGVIGFCKVYSMAGNGITMNPYANAYIIYNTVCKCGGTGISRSDNNYGNVTIIGNVCYGNTTNWSMTNQSCATAKFNAGASGDNPPYTVAYSTLTSITSADFVDYTNNDFHIVSASRLRHNHVDFPSGNNLYSGITVDYDNDTLPSTYSTDDDQWDIGYDYYVEPITGYIWRVRDSEITNGAVTLTGTTNIEEVGNASNTSTLASISSGTNKDTLKIVDGVIATVSDYAQSFPKRGMAIDVDDGEFILSNSNTTHGIQLWGWITKKINVGALGKFTVNGNLINLCTVANLDADAWTVFWSTDVDSNSNFPEPSVIFIGSTAGTALPYYSKGAISRSVENDATHGRLFTFNSETGAITFPDNTPVSTDNVYIFNSMLHSRDGQSTNLTSFAFDTTSGGKFDVNNCYHTGSNNFTGASQLTLDGFGIIQPIVIDNCQSISLNVYRGFSSDNNIATTSTIKNIIGEASLGSYSSIGTETNLELYNIINSTFTSINCALHATQSASNYPIIIGSSSGGTDNLNLGGVTVLGGGIQYSTSQSNTATIASINHSNECSGTNSSNLQHVLYVGASGIRDLTIRAINIISTDGFPTNLDIINITNVGKLKITSIDYNANIRNIGYLTNCFDGLISGFSVAQISGQPFKLKGDTKDITIQNGYSTSTGTIAAFDYYTARDIRLKNISYQDEDEYLIASWSTGAKPDMNFIELNKYGTPYTGVIVQNFYRSSKNEFTFTGGAKSNQNDSVLLPREDDSVTVTSSYAIKNGTITGYFRNTAPVIVGTNTSNYTVEYRLNVNNDGYGSWKSLTGANLSGETLPEDSDFYLQLRVTCTSASATNGIKQIVIYTNPDVSVVYPSDLVSLTLQNIKDGSRYQIDNLSTGSNITTGTQSGTGDIVTNNIPYNGVDETLRIKVRKSSSVPKYRAYTTIATLTSAGAIVYVNQELDGIAT